MKARINYFGQLFGLSSKLQNSYRIHDLFRVPRGWPRFRSPLGETAGETLLHSSKTTESSSSSASSSSSSSKFEATAPQISPKNSVKAAVGSSQSLLTIPPCSCCSTPLPYTLPRTHKDEFSPRIQVKVWRYGTATWHRERGGEAGGDAE